MGQKSSNSAYLNQKYKKQQSSGNMKQWKPQEGRQSQPNSLVLHQSYSNKPNKNMKTIYQNPSSDNYGKKGQKSQSQLRTSFNSEVMLLGVYNPKQAKNDRYGEANRAYNYDYQANG